MLSRRQFLTHTLKTSSLLALAPAVPGFLASTAFAAETGKNTVLVVIELSGGNDGLNTVIPYADDLYHKARPTSRFTKDQVVRVDDYIGLHPSLGSFGQLMARRELALVQGVGYPNPDRSHFESMDVWQSGDPKRLVNSGWIARGAADLQDKKGNVPIMQIGPNRLPLALQGSAGAAVSINNQHPYHLDLGPGNVAQRQSRRKLVEALSQPAASEDKNSLLQFVQRRQVQTYSTLDRLAEVLKSPNQQNNPGNGTNLGQKLQLVARLIQAEFGTRVFYVNLDGFDTHSGQAEMHPKLLQELSDSINNLFMQLQPSGHDKRVAVMTFSEFGRRVQENGSKGTDHGAGSCLFVAGPAIKGGAVSKHPSLKDLDSGDLKYSVDFRQVYATLLDKWLGCDSRTVLGGSFAHLDLLKAKA
jgi:uncharacterized protein (DUF1501 family)